MRACQTVHQISAYPTQRTVRCAPTSGTSCQHSISSKQNAALSEERNDIESNLHKNQKFVDKKNIMRIENSSKSKCEIVDKLSNEIIQNIRLHNVNSSSEEDSPSSIKSIFLSKSFNEMFQNVKKIRSTTQPFTYPITEGEIPSSTLSPLPVSCLEHTLVTSSFPIETTVDVSRLSISDDAFSLSSISTDESFLSSFNTSPTSISPMRNISQLSDISMTASDNYVLHINSPMLYKASKRADTARTNLPFHQEFRPSGISKAKSQLCQTNTFKEKTVTLSSGDAILRKMKSFGTSTMSKPLHNPVCCGDISVSKMHRASSNYACTHKIFSTKQDKVQCSLGSESEGSKSKLFPEKRQILPSVPVRLSGIPLFRSNFRVTRRFRVIRATCLIALWKEITYGVRAKDRRLIGILHRFPGAHAELMACEPVSQSDRRSVCFIYLHTQTWDQMRWVLRDIDVCYPDWGLSRQLTH